MQYKTFWQLMNTAIKKEMLKKFFCIELPIIFLGVFLLYGRILCGDILWKNDTIPYQLPEKFLIREALSNGELPYVNQFILCGTNFLGNIDAGILNPLNFLLLFGDFIFGYHLFVFVHLFLAALAMNLFLRISQKASVLVSVPFSLLYSFGYVWSATGNGFYRCAYLVPLFFLFFLETILSKNNSALKRFFMFLGATISLVLLIFCGNFLEAYFSIIFAFCFAIFNFLILRLKNGIYNWKSIKISLAIFLFSGLLSAPQTIPSYLASNESYRNNGIPLVEAQQWSFPPWRLLEFVIPCAFGERSGFGFWTGGIYTVEETFSKTGASPFSDSVFIGLAPLIGLGLVSSKKLNRKTMFMLLCLIFSFSIAFGKYTPLYKILYCCLPGFKIFRHPEKFIFFAQFWMIACGAVGLDSIRRMSIERMKKASKWLFLFAAFFTFALLVGVIFFVFHTEIFTEYFIARGSQWNGEKIALWLFAMSASSVLALCAFYFGAKIFWNKRRYLLAIFATASFCHALFISLAVKWTIPRSFFEGLSPWTELVTNFEKDKWRIYRTEFFCFNEPINITTSETLDILIERELKDFRSLECNLPALFGIRTVQGFSPVLSQAYSDMMNFEIRDPDEVLDELSVRYIGSKKLLPNYLPKNSRFLIESENGYSIIENLDARPRVEAFKAKTHAFLDNEISDCVNVEILPSRSLNKTVLKVWNGPAFVLLRDFYMKGWRCINSNREDLQVEKTEQGLMRVCCLKKDDTLVFSFSPPGFHAGICFALAGIAGIGLLAWLLRSGRFRSFV